MSVERRSEREVRRRGSAVLKLAAVGGLLAAGAWAYYANAGVAGRSMEMSVRGTPETAAFPVAVAPVARAPIAGTVTYTGTVAPYNDEDIFARVTGRVVEIPVYPGDAVRAGQVVARLDDVELSSRVLETEAMAAGARASRAQMESDLLAARLGIVQMQKELAMIDADLTYARAVAARAERLVAAGAVSQQEYENERTMATSLEARRDAARAKLEQAGAMEGAAQRKLEAAGSMVAQSQAALQTARIVRDYTRILAPSSGYVVKRLVAPGVLVQPGMAILKTTQIDRVRLQANVGEKDVQSVRVGSPVTITSVNGASAPLQARVTAVFPFVDQGARTAVVEVVVDNAGRRFLPGQYVAMRFTTGERSDTLTVPRAAVARLGGKAAVWVMEDGRAQPRPVITGLEGAEHVEIVQGLAVGERVVARGHGGLYAGARIAEVETAAERAATPAPKTDSRPPTGETPATPKGAGHAGH